MQGIKQYQIQYSPKRKHIALLVDDDARLIVKAPVGASEDFINAAISRHRNWIEQKIAQIKARDPRVRKRQFVNGEGFLYLGHWYRLAIVKDQAVPLTLNDYFYLSEKYLPYAREVFIAWYKNAALSKISERVEKYANLTGLRPDRVKITRAQKRWGSCSVKGSVNFSYRLIMAPLPVVDYVVVHELVHLLENNHSRRFWNNVKVLMPDYEKHEQWLKENGYLLKV
ncbi:M48 family metallopeptidase [Desulfovulcanus sp.]